VDRLIETLEELSDRGELRLRSEERAGA
jgi:hypothetical protein